MLIVFGGLPGVGKTGLSRAVAAKLRCTLLRIDAIEAAMWHAGAPEDVSGIGAYAVAHTVAAGQLGLGGSVVVDAVNPVAEARQGWHELAGQREVPLRMIEVICSDVAEHRRRVESRIAEPDQPRLPSWQDVLSRQYEPWAGPRLTVDALAPAEQSMAQIVAYCA